MQSTVYIFTHQIKHLSFSGYSCKCSCDVVSLLWPNSLYRKYITCFTSFNITCLTFSKYGQLRKTCGHRSLTQCTVHCDCGETSTSSFTDHFLQLILRKKTIAPLAKSVDYLILLNFNCHCSTINCCRRKYSTQLLSFLSVFCSTLG